VRQEPPRNPAFDRPAFDRPAFDCPGFDRLLRRQHAVATRAQLLAAGISRSQSTAQLNAGRWNRLNDRVICLHNGPPTRRQQLWAVLLSAPPIAALCGLTVLELHRTFGFPTKAVHVLVPDGRRVLPVPGVEIAVHRCRRFPDDDVRLFDELRSTLPHRAIIDAASWTTDGLTASRLLVAGVQQLRIYPTLLRDEVLARKTLRNHRLLLLLCNDLEGGAQALSEVEFLAFCRRQGFPRPKLQVRMDTNGRRRYLDATFTRADGSTFGVEIDGGIHLQLKVKARDDLKDNDAKLARRLVLRYASVLIYTDDPEAVEQIRRALAGWGG
jgi:hypothetical protein